jgi:hypothetical protein
VVAVHREGVGSVLLVPTNRSISIRLQPWGRIEGTLRLRTRPNAGQEIMYFDSRKFDPEQPFSPSPGEYTTKTDAQGNFVFAQAPPGRFSLCLSNAGHQTPVDIQSGATTVAQIGGTGCVLSGRLVLSNSDQPLDWSKRLLNPGLQTRLPVPQGLSPSARSEWMRQYTQTEEGRARVRDWISYPLDVQTDGAFSVEDVPPGDYELTGQLSDAAIDPTGRVKATVIGSFRQDVTVPQPSSAASGDSIDVGAIPVQPQKP